LAEVAFLGGRTAWKKLGGYRS